MKTYLPEHTSSAQEAFTVAVLVYEGCEIIDVTGPVGVFEMTNRTLREISPVRQGYHIVLLAEKAGTVATCSGVSLLAESRQDYRDKIDTLVIPGSPDDELFKIVQDKCLITWIKDTAPNLRRLVSVCAGAFILAETGLLDSKRATTHWMDTERLGREYPKISVEPDAIFVKDGFIVTAAGVTAGIDLALALVEEDFGKKVALAVARRLVVYLKRPGGQTQFSTRLRAQMAPSGSFASIISWLEDHYHLKNSVDDLAAMACMSPRNFARKFIREAGMTPAKYVELVRLEHAIQMLEDSLQSVEAIATKCGFSTPEQLRRAFYRNFGIGPTAYRERF